MSLKFEKKPEIRLGKAPLFEVICQVKFSPILSISKEIPSDFQERIRFKFPIYETVQDLVFQIPNVKNIENTGFDIPPKYHNFRTPDEKNTCTLASEYFSFTTNDYSHWSNYLENLVFIEETAVDVYDISAVNRIGLRFINKFTKKNSGCDSTSDLLRLFREELTCLVKAEPWEEPTEMFSQLVLQDGKFKLAVRIGLGKQNSERFFVLDFDYFEEGKDLRLKDFRRKINLFHSRIYDAFRWCIKEDSLNRFIPIS